MEGTYTPYQAREMEESGGSDAIHVSAQGATNGNGLDVYIPPTKGKHLHPGDQSSQDLLEGGGGYH